MGATGRRRRDEIVEGAASAVLATGLARLTVAAVAGASGASRATVYRHFPGGRAELIAALAEREVTVFADAMCDRLDAGADLGEALRLALAWGGAILTDHVLLQRSLDTAPADLAIALAEAGPIGRERVRTRIETRVTAEYPHRVRPDCDADYLARMLLSLVENSGSVRLDRDADLSVVVEEQFLAGLRPPLEG